MRKADKYAWRIIAIAMTISVFALACLATPVKAQRFAVVATCGTLTQAAPAVGSAGIVTMDQNGVLCTSATGGGGGGAVTVADGADVTQGTTTDAACATDNGTCTAIQLLKRENQRLTTLITNLGTANANGTATEANSSPVVGKLTPTGTSGSALTQNVCGSAVSSCVIKASAGNFYGAYATCSVACYMMVFNAASAPSNGATTAGFAASNMVDCIAIPTGDQRGVSYTTFPVAMSTGVTVAISSTACATLTLATTGFIHGTVQ